MDFIVTYTGGKIYIKNTGGKIYQQGNKYMRIKYKN